MTITTTTLDEYSCKVCIDVAEGCFDDVTAKFSINIDGKADMVSIRLGEYDMPADQVVQMIGPMEVVELENHAEEKFYDDHPSGTSSEWDDE